MGSDLNEAGDSEPVMRFYEVWLRRYLECGGNLPPGERESARELLKQALLEHLVRMNDESRPWGVKVPRNILMLPFWREIFPELSFVHLVRDGLDMAYSKDRNQLRMVGDLVLTSEELSLPEHLRAIAYWQRVNLMAAAYGENHLGSRYLRLRFEDLCANPKWAYEQLCQFLELRNGSMLPVEIENEVISPASIGRWRRHPKEETEGLLDAASVGLRRFGYSDWRRVARTARTGEGRKLGRTGASMSTKLVTITGGSGFVGQLLRIGLTERGYRVQIFDRLRGRLVNLLRRRYLGTSRSSLGLACAKRIRSIQKRLEPALLRSGVLRPSPDDILAFRSQVAARLKGSHAVIHLAGIPHPRMPGAIDEDFRRINYGGSVNVYEAARSAGVGKFLFASSGQVYGINEPVRIDQFPILESNYCPTLEDGQNLYGWLKLEFERYMERAASNSTMQSVSLRIEFPGLLSKSPANFYISTSIENLIDGFVSALEAPADFAFEAVNLADAEVDPEIVDIQEFIKCRWPEVPNHTTGNQGLLSIDKARRLLGYSPVRDGHYIALSLAGP